MFKKAFTLIELLVVISIIGILAALTISTVTQVTQKTLTVEGSKVGIVTSLDKVNDKTPSWRVDFSVLSGTTIIDQVKMVAPDDQRLVDNLQRALNSSRRVKLSYFEHRGYRPSINDVQSLDEK